MRILGSPLSSILLLPACLAVGCGGSSSPATTSPDATTQPVDSAAAATDPKAPPASAGLKQDGLKVEAGGSEVKDVYAVARDSAGELDVLLASQPVGCDFEADEAKFRLHLGLGYKLLPDGKLVRRIVSHRFDATQQTQLDIDPKLAGSEAEGGTLTMDLDLPSEEGADKPAFRLKGKLKAPVCPADQQALAFLKDAPASLQAYQDIQALASGSPPAAPGPKLTVAGMTLPIRAACLERGKGSGPGGWTTLKLRTVADCKSSAWGAFQLEIAVDPKEPKKIKQVTLLGELTGQAINQNLDPKKVRVTPMPKAAAETTLELELKMPSGHAVKASGKVNVQAVE